MNNTQGLYYAFGELAYAVAAADGVIGEAEKKALHAMLLNSLDSPQLGFDYSEIIFQILAKDHTNIETAYKWAIDELKLHEYYLTEKIKNEFVRIIENIASAGQTASQNKLELVNRFKRDIIPLKGDSVFTS